MLGVPLANFSSQVQIKGTNTAVQRENIQFGCGAQSISAGHASREIEAKSVGSSPNNQPQLVSGELCNHSLHKLMPGGVFRFLSIIGRMNTVLWWDRKLQQDDGFVLREQ